MKTFFSLIYCFSFLFFVTGCSGTGKSISIHDYPEIKKTSAQVQFYAVNSFKTDSKIGKVNASFTDSESVKWEQTLVARMTDNDFEKMWSELRNQNPELFNRKENPQYIAKIELAAIMTGLDTISPRSLFWHGYSLYKVSVFDDTSKLIHEKFIKIYGLWRGNGLGSVKGPAKMGYSYPNKAIAKLGLYDAVAYICRGDFLSKESGGIELITHIPKGLKPKRVVEELPFLSEEKSQSFYKPIFGALIYSKYIMAEKITTQDLAGMEFNIQAAAKLGFEKNWPYFPKNLDVTGVHMSFQ